MIQPPFAFRAMGGKTTYHISLICACIRNQFTFILQKVCCSKSSVLHHFSNMRWTFWKMQTIMNVAHCFHSASGKETNMHTLECIRPFEIYALVTSFFFLLQIALKTFHQNKKKCERANTQPLYTWTGAKLVQITLSKMWKEKSVFQLMELQFHSGPCVCMYHFQLYARVSNWTYCKSFKNKKNHFFPHIQSVFFW